MVKKLIDKLQTTRTGIFHIDHDCKNISSTINIDVTQDDFLTSRYEEIFIGLKIGAIVRRFCDDENGYENAIIDVKKALLNEIYGDLRPLLHSLKLEIYNRDQRASIDTLNEISNLIDARDL